MDMFQPNTIADATLADTSRIVEIFKGHNFLPKLRNNEFVHEDLPEVASSGSVEREDAGETLGCEHDRVPYAFGVQRGFHFLWYRL